MAKFHHIDVTDHDFLIERIASAAVEQTRLAGFLHPTESFLLVRLFQVLADLVFRDAVKDWGGNFETERFRRDSEVSFEHLSDIHTARHAQWIEDDFNWRSIRQKRHVFLG